MRQLEATRYATRVGRDGWVLARDLERTTLYDLYQDLHLGVATDALRWMQPSPRQARAGESIVNIDALGRECMAVPLKDLFADTATARADSGRNVQTDGEVVPFSRS